VAWAGLYRLKPGLLRLDVAPFAFAYSVLWAGALAPLLAERPDEKAAGDVALGVVPLWVLVAMPVVLLLHVLTHLSTHWAVACDALVAYSKARDADGGHTRTNTRPIDPIPSLMAPISLSKPQTQVKSVALATHVRVRPPPNSGSEELVALVREAPGDDGGDLDGGPLAIAGQAFARPFASFSFQKTGFCYWEARAAARECTRLAYPTEGAVSLFLQRRGYATRRELGKARALWGDNVFDIPLPPFGDLFKVRFGTPHPPAHGHFL